MPLHLGEHSQTIMPLSPTGYVFVGTERHAASCLFLEERIVAQGLGVVAIGRAGEALVAIPREDGCTAMRDELLGAGIAQSAGQFGLDAQFTVAQTDPAAFRWNDEPPASGSSLPYGTVAPHREPSAWN